MGVLRDQMIRELRLRRYAPATHRAYLAAVVGLTKHCRIAPDQLSARQVQDYLLYLMMERKLHWNTVNAICSGLTFFCTQTVNRPDVAAAMPLRRTPRQLPEIRSGDELKALFAAADNLQQRALLMTTYSGGLGVSEVVKLRPCDIDSQRMMIRVVAGKRGKDRYTLLSVRLLEELRAYWRAYRPLSWLEERRAELLPVGYFHNVFTLPHELNDLAMANPRLVYGLLFRKVAATLQSFAADPQYGLGGQAGFTAVLHTWDQKLLYHVHLHCVIAGGALALDGSRWIPARRNYLFPVRKLSRDSRARFLKGLQQAFARNQLVFPGRLAAFKEAAPFTELLARLAAKDWAVYSQPPFGGADKVLEYLSRYTHRVAISNRRLLAIADGKVTFAYRDRRDGNQLKELTIGAPEFLRRFLLHVTPPGLCRIRHYGFLSNRYKEHQLPRCRELLGQPPPPKTAAALDVVALLLRFTGIDVTRCPHCRQGTLVAVERILAAPPTRGASAPARRHGFFVIGPCVGWAV